MNHGQELIRHALSLIEDEQFLLAAQTAQEAYCYYAESGRTDWTEGAIDALAAEVSAWQHMHHATGNHEYAKRALSVATYMGELHTRHEVLSRSALVMYRLGTAYMANQRYQDAEKYLDTAVKNFQGSYEPETYDWQVHLGEATFYASSADAGLELMSEAEDVLAEFRKKETDFGKLFLLDVWLSGVRLKLAELISRTDREKALPYLSGAREIIEANPRLKIRRQQLDLLTAKLQS